MNTVINIPQEVKNVNRLASEAQELWISQSPLKDLITYVPVRIRNFEDLAVLICQEHWSPIVFDKEHRHEDNFAGCSLLVLDVDDTFSLEDAKERFKDTRCIIAPTENHQKDKKTLSGFIKPACDRFRIVLFLDEEITSVEKYKKMTSHYLSEFHFADSSCGDGARFFKPSATVFFANDVGKLISTTFKSKQINQPQQNVDQTFADITGDEAEKCIATLDDQYPYDEWLSICFGIVEQFGAKLGKELILSKWGTSDAHQIAGILKHVANNHDSEKSKNTWGTVVHFAKLNGYTPPRKTTPISKREMVEDFLKTQKHNLTSALLTEEILNYIEIKWKTSITERRIDMIVIRHKALKRKETIKSYCITSGAPTKYISILNPLLQCDDSEKPYYNAVFLHAFQNIKRKMMGKKAKMPLCPVLYGRQQGTGKSFFINMFKDYFGDLARIADGGDLNDKWARANVYKSFFVFLDEMAKMNKTDANVTKKAITEDVLEYRRFHSGEDGEQLNLATFFGATNYSLEEVFGGIETSRRFIEIPVINTRFPRDYVNNIDISDFWACIDTEYAYLTPKLEEKLLIEAAPIDSIAAWLQNGFLQDDEKTKYTSAELHDLYCQYCKHNRIQSVHNVRRSKSGFAARLKQHYHSGSMKHLGCVRLNESRSLYYFNNTNSIEDDHPTFSLAYAQNLNRKEN